MMNAPLGFDWRPTVQEAVYGLDNRALFTNTDSTIAETAAVVAGRQAMVLTGDTTVTFGRDARNADMPSVLSSQYIVQAAAMGFRLSDNENEISLGWGNNANTANWTDADYRWGVRKLLGENNLILRARGITTLSTYTIPVTIAEDTWYDIVIAAHPCDVITTGKLYAAISQAEGPWQVFEYEIGAAFPGHASTAMYPMYGARIGQAGATSIAISNFGHASGRRD